VKRGRVAAVLCPAIGVALAPTSFAVLWSAGRSLSVLIDRSRAAEAFLIGFGGYALAYLLGWMRFRRAYVFAHESTHAFAAWIGGGKVFRFVVHADRGHVDLSRVNAFIALAPYWVPLYALLLIIGYRAFLWPAPSPHWRTAFEAGLGGCLAFHCCHTAQSLSMQQSDLDYAGWTLSLSLIALLNGLVLLVLLGCLFPRRAPLAQGLGFAAHVSAAFWHSAAAGLASAAQRVRFP